MPHAVVYTGGMAISSADDVSDEGGRIQLAPSPWERATELADHGRVAWLANKDRETYALFPAELAHAALEALEEREDIEAAVQARTEPSVSYESVRAELGLK